LAHKAVNVVSLVRIPLWDFLTSRGKINHWYKSTSISIWW